MILVVNLEYFEDFVKVVTAAFTAFNLFHHARNANLTKTGHANSIKNRTKEKLRTNNGTMSSKRFVVVLL